MTDREKELLKILINTMRCYDNMVMEDHRPHDYITEINRILKHKFSAIDMQCFREELDFEVHLYLNKLEKINGYQSINSY